MVKRFEEHQIEALELSFQESKHLTRAKKMKLVEATGLDMEQVTGWFNRKRANKRAREAITQLEINNSILQQTLKLSQDSKTTLLQILEESKRRAAELQDENQHLKLSLTFTEGDDDEQFGNLDEVCEWIIRDKPML